MHHFKISIRRSQIKGLRKEGSLWISSVRTLGLKELQLAVEELKMGLGKNNLGDIFLARARASANIARLSHSIVVVNALHLGGVVVGHLGRHSVR